MNKLQLMMKLEEVKMEEKIEREKLKEARLENFAKQRLEKIKENEKQKNKEIKKIKEKLRQENKKEKESPLAKVTMFAGGLANKKYANPVTFVDNLKKKKK